MFFMRHFGGGGANNNEVIKLLLMVAFLQSVLLSFQESQLCAQQPVQSELVQRCQQLQSRLSTLKIENEEVS